MWSPPLNDLIWHVTGVLTSFCVHGNILYVTRSRDSLMETRGLQDESISPNTIVYNSLITACENLLLRFAGSLSEIKPQRIFELSPEEFGLQMFFQIKSSIH